MKTILFILIPFLAVSQSPETASEIQLVRSLDDHGDQWIGDPPSEKSYSIGIDPDAKSFRFDDIVMLSDLIEYQTECYNDSMHVLEHTFVPKSIMDCIYDYGCIYQHHYGWVTHHKEPTFTGFIEWLKKRKQ